MTIPFRPPRGLHRRRRRPICILATAASAKEGFLATLTSAIPPTRSRGTTIKVAWDGEERRLATASARPPMFVRLRGPAGGNATEGFASVASHPGRCLYRQGAGAAGRHLRRRDRCRRHEGRTPPAPHAPTTCSRSRTRRTCPRPGSGSGTGTLTWLLPLLGGLAALAVVVLALRRRAVAMPQARTG
jgi:hypothetical protein